MGIIDEDLHSAVIGYLFEPSGDPAGIFNACDDLLRRDFLRDKDANGGKDIVDIEFALELRRDIEGVSRHLHRKLCAILEVPDILGPHLNGRSESIGVFDIRSRLKELPGVIRVEIDYGYLLHPGLPPVSDQVIEQLELHFHVILHGLVEIEMILRYVRKHHFIVIEAVVPVIEDRMARCLDDGEFASRRFRFPQKPLKDEWGGAGHFEVVLGDGIPYHVVHRREHEHFVSSVFESFRNQIRRGRLPFRPGDSDDDHVLRRIPEEEECENPPEVMIKFPHRAVERDDFSEIHTRMQIYRT